MEKAEKKLDIQIVKPKRTRVSGEAKMLRDAQAQLAKATMVEVKAAIAYENAKQSVARINRYIDALAADTENGQPHVPEAA